jgi:hypothetical protein
VSAQAFASSIERTDAVSATWQDAVWQRVGPVSGIIFVILVFIGLTVSDPNSADVDANPEQDSSVIANLFMENRADFEFGVRFQIASIVFLIWFLAYLHRRIQRAEGERGWVATAMLGGGAAYVAVMLIFTAVTLAISTIDDYGSDAAVARTLAALTWDVVGLWSAPLAALTGSITVAALRYRALPRWVGYTGAPLALVMLVAPISFLSGLFWFAFLFFWFWLLALSIYTTVRPQVPGIAASTG